MRKWLILITIFFAGFSLFFLKDHAFMADTPCYVAGAQMIFGLSGGGDCNFSMNKPLPLVFAGLFEKITGYNAKYGLLFQNLIFYFISSFLIFEIFKRVFNDEKKAFLGFVIFTTAPPILLSGFDYSTDMAGWFFGILGVYLTLHWFKKFEKETLFAFLFGLIIGLGFLYKESALMAIIFFGIYILTSTFNTRNKLRLLMLSSFGFLIPLIISGIIIYTNFGYNFLDWYRFNSRMPYSDYYDFPHFLRAFWGTLGLFWFLFFIGFYKIYQDFKQKNITATDLKFFLASGATILLWPIWPIFLSRVFYLSSPFLIGIALGGAFAFPQKRAVALIVLIAILNIWTVML